MSSSPRHRLEPDEDRPPHTYTGPIAVSSMDFDAVAPRRHPARYAEPALNRQPTGDGPAQLSDPDPLSTSDALFLAHS